MRNPRVRLCVVAIALLCGSQVSAQEITGSIRGKILDASEAVVSNADVTATRPETGLARTVRSDPAGEFDFVELPIGHYRVSVEAKGFQKYVQTGIRLDVNQTAMVTMRLTVGTATQQIEVRADALLIESTITSLGKTVEEREVLNLPLNGRNFSQLGLLQPGVVPITPGLAVAGGSLRSGQAYAVNGQRPESNNFLIDGADNFNGVDGGFVIQPPIDSIAEFHILTHSANAEFGHSTGSTTNVITRSGTNAFHGAVWKFLRNDAMGAKSFFAPSVEALKRNQFGGTVGGPIKRDKTFFFGYYEGLRNRQGETVSATVPTALEKQGDYSQNFDSQGHLIPLINDFTGQPFPGNKLPFVDPSTAAVAALFPLPNNPGVGPNAFTSTQTLSQNNNQFGLRVDHYLTSREVLNFRYVFTQGDTIDPLSTSGANVPGFPVGEAQRAQNFVAQETHTFSPTMTGVARLSFLRNKFLFDEHLNHTTPASLGFQYAPQLDAAIGPPFVQVAGYASVGDPITGPRNTYENSLDLSGSLTWITDATN
jgi:Carboxypeptidase regulatory-like domain